MQGIPESSIESFAGIGNPFSLGEIKPGERVVDVGCGAGIDSLIAAKKVNLSMDEARDLAKRALKFKTERGRLPSITSPDPWERRMAEGIAFLARKKTEAANA